MLQQNFPMDNQTTKLCILIAPKEDAGRLTDARVAHDSQSTQISSSGGFLRKGSTTIFCALNEDRVGDLLGMLRKNFPETVESVPAASLPFISEPDWPNSQMIDIRVGGVVIFIVPLEGFGSV